MPPRERMKSEPAIVPTGNSIVTSASSKASPPYTSRTRRGKTTRYGPMKKTPTAVTSASGQRSSGVRATIGSPLVSSRSAGSRGPLRGRGGAAGTRIVARAPAARSAAWTPSIGALPIRRAAPAERAPRPWAPNCTAVMPVTARIRSAPATRDSSVSRAGITNACTLPMQRP